MTKYPIHPDFKKYEKIKTPITPLLLPLMNGVLKQSFNKRAVDKGVCESRKTILGFKKQAIEVIIYEPEGNKKPLPCLIYLHGGAFVLKSAPFHKGLICDYVKKTPCKVVFVDYRLAPRYPFPVGLEDSYASLEWVIDQAEEIGIDPKKIAIAGDSAGGALAAGLCLLARDRQAVKICFQMLVYPVTDARQMTESIKTFVDTPLWNARQNKKMWRLYLKGEAYLDSAYASPLEAHSFLNLPDTYIEVAEFDCLRDEGILLAKALKESDINVELHRTKGTIHGYEVAENSEVVKASVIRRIAALKQAFGQ